jgi:hypothetical protein
MLRTFEGYPTPALGNRAFLLHAACGLLLFAACSGDEKVTGKGEAKTPELTLTGLEHEDCKEGGNRVESLDQNKDGKADMKRVFDKGSNRELCHMADLDHDGKPELFEYFDESGKIRRREHMYDDTGAVSQIEVYENGKLLRRDLDSRGQHRIDTIDYFDPVTGKRIKRERDENGDGNIDQWWSFRDDRIEIAMDKNGDGKPDPEATVTLGPSGSPFDAGPPEGGPTSSGGEGGGAPPPPPPPVLFQELPDAGPVKDAGAKKPAPKK